jgi:uncharacterized RDD family membrane protein YckC
MLSSEIRGGVVTPDNNPYMPPAEDAPSPRLEPIPRMNEASGTQRAFTLLIDQVAMYALISVFIAFRLHQSGGKSTDEDLGFQVFSWFVLVGYYIVLEATTGRTVGKLVMGTKVVTETGGVPTFGQIVGRSFARLVPFDPFSFLASKPGWHDRWSGTRVIRTR